MTKAKTSGQSPKPHKAAKQHYPVSMVVHGLPLYEIDGKPYAMDVEYGAWVGRKDGERIRDRIRNSPELLSYGSFPVVREMIDTAKPAQVEVTTYYLSEDHTLLLTLLGRTEKSAEFRKLLIEIFKAWRDGKLVSRAEAAEAALQRPRATPQFSPFNQSRFAYGPPRAVPSNLVHAIAKDRVLKRFHTSLGITVTVIGDGLTILDHDLGFAIGGEMTLKARPITRPLLPQLRKMGADPAHVIDVVGVRGRQEASTYFFLNHEQAKVVAESLDPHGHTAVQSQIDMLFYKAARGELATIAIDAEGREAAALIDAKAHKRGYRIHERYAHEPAARTPTSVDDRAMPDPCVITMIGDIMEKIAMPMAAKVDELSSRLDSIDRALSAPTFDHRMLAEISALRQDMASILQSQIVQGPEPATNRRDAGLAFRMRCALDAFMNPKA